MTRCFFYNPDEFLNQVLEDEKEEHRKKVAHEKAQETTKEIAMNMIHENFNNSTISKLTGLSLEEVKELKKTMKN